MSFKDKKIAIIAPASGSASEAANITKFKQILKDANYEYKISDDLFSSTAIPFYSNTKQYRIDNFRKYLTDAEVGIIWCERGGYGSLEVAAESLDFKPVLPKIIIGFSDITAMHALFNQKYNFPSIHGQLVNTMGGAADFAQIIDTISGKEQKLTLTAINSAAKSPLSGTISGGNLTVYTTLIGTKLHPKTDGHILVLEDVSEKGYAIKRHLMHLLYCGLLDSVKAIIFGEFTDGDEYVDYAIKDFCVSEVPKIPTYRAAHVGHVSPNYPIVFGITGTIDGNVFSFKFT